MRIANPSSSEMGVLRTVLFDAGNTLVFLDYARIGARVSQELRLSITGEGLRAQSAEAAQAMAQVRGNDRSRATTFLDRLFLLAGVPADRLEDVKQCLAKLHAERHLWCETAPGTREGLESLRTRGFRLGVVSNSDGRVDEALSAAGLLGCFEVVVDSHRVGFEKPDPRIFQVALDALAVPAAEALYVGDLYEVDVVGAGRAGLRAVLVSPSQPVTAVIADLLAGTDRSEFVSSLVTTE